MIRSIATEFLLAAPNGPGELDTEAVVSFLAAKIAPILVAGIGVVIMGRAAKGNMSTVLTSSVIALIGLAFVAGATVLFFVGETLIDVMFK